MKKKPRQTKLVEQLCVFCFHQHIFEKCPYRFHDINKNGIPEVGKRLSFLSFPFLSSITTTCVACPAQRLSKQDVSCFFFFLCCMHRMHFHFDRPDGLAVKSVSSPQSDRLLTERIVSVALAARKSFFFRPKSQNCTLATT